MNREWMRKTLCFALASGTLSLMPFTASAQTINEAIEETMETNPQVLFSATRSKTDAQQIGIAKSGYYPKVDLTVGYGYEWTDNASTEDTDMTRRENSIRATQMLYDGYATKSSVDSAESGAQASVLDLAATSEDMALKVTEVYLDVLRYQQLLTLTQESLDAHQATHDRIKQRYDSGLGTQSDLQQAQSRLALAKSNMVVAEGNLWEAAINFERVVGHPPKDLVMPEDDCCTYLPSTPEDAVTIALTTHPALLAAIARHESSLAQENIARAAFHPQLDLELSAATNHGVDGKNYTEDEMLAMLKMRYNAYNGGADSARVEQLQHLSKAQRASVLKVQRELKADAFSSWNKLKNIYDTQPQLERHAKSAAETRSAYTRQFDIGQRSLLDLLDTENEYFTARSAEIHGTFDEWYARYRLLADVGKLLLAMQVSPDFDSVELAGQ
ncbi:channel protein TolC [Marinobacterium zhoushanense]|uniref:Channel protein TolC n=1 Tax=Marinobacterium zhoushanense TaxID=1679163 RepID=A0ABQ1JYW6_9GAMM|nr:TolC family outer membrane protein [Marinobacterium zhoushanense]GGB78473.1 channel protein TolC [Marinobacterium zhoushanense]